MDQFISDNKKIKPSYQALRVLCKQVLQFCTVYSELTLCVQWNSIFFVSLKEYIYICNVYVCICKYMYLLCIYTYCTEEATL